MNLEIIDATQEHVLLLAPLLRDADLKELKASSGRTAQEALSNGVDLSVYAKTALVDGNPIAMWGCAPYLNNIGSAWLLGSDWIEKHQLTFWKNSNEEFSNMCNFYDVLFNFVDSRNELSIRWLRRLGFQEEAEEPQGISQLPFKTMVKYV